MYFLATFSQDEAMAPVCPWNPPRVVSPGEKPSVEKLIPQHKEEVALHLGRATLLYHQDTYSSYATDGEVHVLLLGEVASWPGGIDAVKANHDSWVRGQDPVEPNDAHWLLDFYRTFDTPNTRSSEVLDRALECLEQVRGSFAFVIYDSTHHRVLAARDRDGVIPLFWGTDPAGMLMFGSDQLDFKDCEPTATLFPAGAMFISSASNWAVSPGNHGWVISGEGMPGELLSFLPAEADQSHFRGIRAIPRITSKGVLCGAIFKVGSNADLARPVIHF